MPTDKEYRDAAISNHQEEGATEIDNCAEVSASEEGAYVQAWIWIGKDEIQ
jgi:hypothetical protein